ncbi:GTP cyclohydrolase 1 [compost metagenome]
MENEVKLTGAAGQETKPISEVIRERIESSSASYFSNDNISQFIHAGEKDKLVDELTGKFEEVLKSLVIDIKNDPNSADTGRRLAKMYVHELFEGRYSKTPNATAFPNDGDAKYEGMLVVRSELKSVCSHHHQPVTGTAYIGIIPGKKVIGLSKYTRIAQWHARRGTLQEELCQRIQKDIASITETPNVAVYIVASHGCCENRGIMAKNSKTQTTVLGGDFKRSDLKQEFFDNIKLQSNFSCE